MQIVNATQIIPPRLCALIYGAPGAGKTSLIGYLPGRTLVFDVDRTSGVLRGNPNVDIVYVDTINAWESWSALLSEIGSSSELAKYDNICLDNVSELERSILAALGRAGRNNGIPAQSDYQFMQFKLMNTLRYMRALNKNLIWTAWEMSDTFTSATGQIYSRSFPRISGKILNNVCGLCNVVGRMSAAENPETGEITRWIELTSNNSTYAKNQYDKRMNCLQSELIGGTQPPAPAPAPQSPRNEARRNLLNVICKQREISPATVREAIAELRNEGAITDASIDAMPEADWATVLAAFEPARGTD